MNVRTMIVGARFVQCVIGAFMLMLGSAVGARDLQQAIAAGDLAKVRALIAAEPARANREIQYHGLPLNLAAAKPDLPMVAFLVEQGAEVNRLDERGENALFSLVRAPFQRGDLDTAANEICQILVGRKVNVNQRNRTGETPLYVLAAYRRMGGDQTLPRKIALMQMLIAHGASLRGQDKASVPVLLKTMEGMSSERASRRNVVETVRFLVENGADPDAASEHGDTALIRILSTETLTDADKLELVTLLIAHGANPRRKNQSRISPLDLVAKGTVIYDAMRRKPGRR